MPTNKTIAVSSDTKERLISIKQHRRETFDDIINRLIDDYNKLKEK